MNSYDQVATFITHHPGVTAKAIMAETGLGPYAVRHILAALAERDVICREQKKTQPLCWWPCQPMQQSSEPLWHKLREKAEGLEKKGFWHRAATVWMQAFDATHDERLRYRATLKRSRCLEKARRPGEAYEGVAIAAVEGIDVWNM